MISKTAEGLFEVNCHIRGIGFKKTFADKDEAEVYLDHIIETFGVCMEKKHNYNHKPKATQKEVKVGRCVLREASGGRCKNYLRCQEYFTCLNIAANKGWLGWKGGPR